MSVFKTAYVSAAMGLSSYLLGLVLDREREDSDRKYHYARGPKPPPGYGNKWRWEFYYDNENDSSYGSGSRCPEEPSPEQGNENSEQDDGGFVAPEEPPPKQGNENSEQGGFVAPEEPPPKQKNGTCGKCDGSLAKSEIIRLPCRHIFHDGCISPQMTKCPFPGCGQAIPQKQQTEEPEPESEKCKLCTGPIDKRDIFKPACGHYAFHERCAPLVMMDRCRYPGCGEMIHQDQGAEELPPEDVKCKFCTEPIDEMDLFVPTCGHFKYHKSCVPILMHLDTGCVNCGKKITLLNQL